MNKFERAKQAKDGLDVFPALMRAAEVGWESLDDDDLMRLKWYGLYAHNTKDGHFMLRTKVVQGILSADQAEVMASITEDFARGIIDCTTRQCFQNHWLTLDEVPEVFARLEQAGLTTAGACGDITRNVVGCTLAGIGHDQILDGQATAEAIHEYFLGNKLYSNLPRKYKISVTGCREDCARGLINDLALSGAIHEDGTPGFNIRVGGGLSSVPRFSRSIDVFVTPEEAPEVVAEITAIFRDSDENRAKRGRARLKFLVDAIGADGFRAALVRRLGPGLTHAAPSAAAAVSAPTRRRARPASAATTTSASRRSPTASTPRSASACRSAACAGTSCTSSCGSRARTRRRPRPASPTSRTCCCRGSPTTGSRRCWPSRWRRSSRRCRPSSCAGCRPARA